MNAASLLKLNGIGLTGGIATGKSTVARYLARRGEVVIDADQLAREVVEKGTPGLSAIEAAFGRGILTPTGMLDRKALGRIVFADAEKKKILEAITHPLIKEALVRRLDALGLAAAPRRFFYEAALIFEAGRQAEFRAVWTTHCSRESQLSRLMARDLIDRASAEKLLASQLPPDVKAQKSTLVISTDAPLPHIEAQVDKALAALSKSSLSAPT